jgi:hypothetical protein
VLPGCLDLHGGIDRQQLVSDADIEQGFEDADAMRGRRGAQSLFKQSIAESDDILAANVGQRLSARCVGKRLQHMPVVVQRGLPAAGRSLDPQIVQFLVGVECCVMGNPNLLS